MTAPRRRVAVIAGNYREYVAWCRENGHPLRGGPVFYATAESLEGLTGVDVIRTGTWPGRDDIGMIEAILRVVNRAVPFGHVTAVGYEPMDLLFTARCSCGAGRMFLTWDLAQAWEDTHGGGPAGVTLLAADEADLAVLGDFGRRLDSGPRDPRLVWRSVARPDQLLPPLDDPWRILLLTGGRGSGKSRSGSQGLVDIILADTEPEGQYGICAPTYRDAWTVDVEGESGLLRALGTSAGEVKQGRSRLVQYAHRSYGEIGLRSGHVIYVDSADDGALRIQGKNLRAIWADEIGLWTRWQTAWDESIRYAVRKGASKIIATGTPKISRPARTLMRRLLRGEEPGVIVRRLRTIDNISNLSQAFYDTVVGAAKGTRLERQELEGELLDDIENALWTRDLLERIAVPAFGQPGGPQYLWQAKVGVDPSDGKEDSDEQAYTVIGRGAPDDPHLYVAENWGGQEAPAPFAKRCVLVAVKYDAELVVEKNHGGEWLRPVFDQAIKDLAKEGRIRGDKLPRVRLVAASKGKRTRAEPISAMYVRDIVRHCRMTGRDFHGNTDVRPMVELEDQMVTFTGADGERSPDRLDSLVWGATPFLDTGFGPPGRSGRVPWAGSQELADIEPEESRAQRRMRELAGQPVPQDSGGNWDDLDGFAPAADPERPRPRRANAVRSWGGQRV